MTGTRTESAAPVETAPDAARVAILVPCFNEGESIEAVVRGFRRAMPGASVYVYDNGSTDDTASVARAAGAVVRTEPRRGKGHVVRRMFADVDADIYVLVDGDDTYAADTAPAMIDRLRSDCLDMVNGRRVAIEQEAYRFGHRVGNRWISAVVGMSFGRSFDDLLSGYRVFSRRFVKSFPAMTTGFEIETETAVHALELSLPVAEVDTPYQARRGGGSSKLSTVRDGLRIAGAIAWLLKEVRPLLTFGLTAVGCALAGLAFGLPVVFEYLETGLVLRFPTAILATGLMILAMVSLVAGLIMDSVSRGRREAKRMHYLAMDPPPRPPGRVINNH